MATITTRSVGYVGSQTQTAKGTPLTNTEIDNNFINLNVGKLETNGSGANLTNLNASNVSSGTLAVARGGTGQTSYINGELLIGNTTGNTLTKATLTAGSNIAITNGTGSISIATSATPSFTTVTTTGNATIGGSITLTGDIAVNGGDITTTATTFNLVTANATTISIGAATGTLTVNNTTLAAKAITASTTLGVTGATTLSNTLSVTGATTLSSTLAVTGNTTLTGDLAVNGGDITTSATTFNIVTTNATAVNIGASTGTLTVNNTTLAAKAITASTTLGVTGNTTLGGTLGVTGATTLGNTLNLVAGTTTVAPLRLTSGTNLTTATAGSVEYNGTVLMATPTSTHRGIIPTEQYYRLTANKPGSTVLTAQGIFDLGVNLAAATQYEFELLVVLTRTNGSTTSHTVALGYNFTGTLNNILWRGEGVGDSALTIPVARINGTQTSFISNTTNPLVVTPAFANAASYLHFKITGTLSVSTAGTFTPQYTLSANPGAYATIAGSYMKIKPIGTATTNIVVGSWA